MFYTHLYTNAINGNKHTNTLDEYPFIFPNHSVHNYINTHVLLSSCYTSMLITYLSKGAINQNKYTGILNK